MIRGTNAAIKLPSTLQGKNTEINHVIDALRANNYPSFVISNTLKWKLSKPPTHVIHSPEDLVCMFFKRVEPQENSNGFAILPFMNGVTQPLTRILRKHDIRVVNKLSPLRLCNENSVLLNSDHLLNTNPMWFIKYPVPTVTSVMWVKPAVVLKPARKNTLAM